MTNTKLLKAKMILFGDEDFVKSLAELLGITRQTASAKLNGDNESGFNQTEIITLTQHYDLSGEEVKEIFAGGENNESM